MELTHGDNQELGFRQEIQEHRYSEVFSSLERYSPRKKHFRKLTVQCCTLRQADKQRRSQNQPESELGADNDSDP